jgi:phage-related protein
MDGEKDLRWIGSSYADLLDFPREPRREAGFQLAKVQAGLDPTDWKPFPDVGAGAKEIRIKDKDGTFRVMYVAKFEEAIYVMHCFQKKSRATSMKDRRIAGDRYRAVIKEREEEK